MEAIGETETIEEVIEGIMAEEAEEVDIVPETEVEGVVLTGV